ncbi:MAG TPA: selenium-binding protein SBP56-related protein [Candidatus Limnocylindrales bacterium]|nr:selenium-binding protein SBP56-related protein [Candidatus Limnocylindrales bacterium]
MKSILSLFAVIFLSASTAHADETCMSPYMAKIVGQEDYVYVWTLGMPGVGDEQDKLVTIDVHPSSKSYGKVIASASVGSRNEAHHSGFTDDRRHLWAAGLDSGRIFIFDVHTNPSKPKVVQTIQDFTPKSGGVMGPHTLYALPGRMLVTGLSNAADRSGRTGMVEYTNDGKYITTHWMPTDADLLGAKKTGQFADGYGYDSRALPRRNALITSSFTGHANYMRDLTSLMADAEAMKKFGNTVVVWNLHQRTPKVVLDVPGAPLEIRCAWGANNDYCFTTTALTSKIWLIAADAQGNWTAEAVGDIGDATKVPLPVDISISSDDRLLWVNTWNDGMTRLFDVSNPRQARQIYEKKIGPQVNMVSESWDGKRLYFTSSLLANWDKKTSDDGSPLQFFKAYEWDGTELKEKFALDFIKDGLGAPHQMRFGSRALYASPAKTARDAAAAAN